MENKDTSCRAGHWSLSRNGVIDVREKAVNGHLKMHPHATMTASIFFLSITILKNKHDKLLNLTSVFIIDQMIYVSNKQT